MISKVQKNLGKAAAENTISKLSPKKIGSEKIAIIFDKRIAKGILVLLLVQYHLLHFRGLILRYDDQKIFSESINIFDKPDIVKGLGSQSFDF